MKRYLDIINLNLNAEISNYDLYLPSNYLVESLTVTDKDLSVDNNIIIKNGKHILNKVNNQLEIDFNCPKNSSVKRIILTDDSSVRFPHIYYQSKSLTYRFNHVHIIYL